MIVMNPQGVMPVGPWNLPSEFSRPNWTTLSSGSAQQILEARGLLGAGPGYSGYSGYGARATSRVPSGNVSTQNRAQFDQLLNQLRVEMSNRGVSGGMRTEQERYMGGPEGDMPGINTYYIQRIGTAEYGVAWSQVTESSSRSGGFYGQVEFGVLDQIDRLKKQQFVPTRQREAVPSTARRTTRTPSRAARSARPARTRATVQARRMAGYGRAAGAQMVQRLPWSRFAGNVDLY